MKLTQTEKLRRFLSDGLPHSTIEIMERVYGGSHLGIARVGARIHDLRSKGLEIEGWKDDKNRAIYWYRMKVRPPQRVEYVNVGGVMHARVIQPEAQPPLMV